MAKVLVVVRRHRDLDIADIEGLRRACRAITPDNLRSPPAPSVHASGRTGFAVMNPGEGCRIEERRVALGHRGPCEPDVSPYDRSHAAFEFQSADLLVTTDVLATRSVWYFQDDELFVASTSQFMILAFIGSFAFNRKTVAWVLSTGTPGPGLSWDRRFRQMKPDSRLRLDHATWQAREEASEVEFRPSAASPRDLKRHLRTTLVDSVSQLARVDWRTWVVALSGGYDSRGILLLLREATDTPVATVTWGSGRLRNDERGDGAIAASLAQALGATNEFFANDDSAEPIEMRLARFVRCSEGRTTSLAGCLDGCEFWRRLREDMGIEATVRGDEAFGWSDCRSERAVRRSVSIRLASDVAELPRLCRLAGLPDQNMPRPLLRRTGETIADWRDRLYQTARAPTYLAGIAEPKLSYVEMVNPLITREIIGIVRTLPEALRTGKPLFKEIVDDFGVDLPYASVPSEDPTGHILARQDIRAVCAKVLGSGMAREILPQAFLDAVLERAFPEPARPARPASLRPRITRVLERLRGLKPLDPNLLLFRTYVVVTTVAICRELAAGREPDGGSVD